MTGRDTQRQMDRMLRRRALPPLDYLLAFEVSAQEESFAAASKVLNIGETSISRKVRLLEEHFGIEFFLRGQRSISLTPQGRAFLAAITPALDLIRTAAEDTLRSSLNRPVVLAATNSVAALWLTPRLQDFRKANPHHKIMLLASDNDDECLGETVDLAILRGDGHWPGFRSEMVFGETVFPVCAPDFLAAHPAASEVARLHSVPLIEVSSAHTEWMNWRTWLSNVGQTRDRMDDVTLFNTYPLAIQAAIEGGGVALGWGHLVDRLLDSGRLVRPLGDRQIRTSHGYFLLQREGRLLSSAGRDLADWLHHVSQTRRRYGTDPTGVGN